MQTGFEIKTRGKGLFLLLSTVTLILMMVITTLLWWFISPRLHEILKEEGRERNIQIPKSQETGTLSLVYRGS